MHLADCGRSRFRSPTSPIFAIFCSIQGGMIDRMQYRRNQWSQFCTRSREPKAGVYPARQKAPSIWAREGSSESKASTIVREPCGLPPGLHKPPELGRRLGTTIMNIKNDNHSSRRLIVLRFTTCGDTMSYLVRYLCSRAEIETSCYEITHPSGTKTHRCRPSPLTAVMLME